MIIYFTVTNDLSYDQRMIRICTSLAKNNYTVKLVGRIVSSSIPLTGQPYQQKRIKCFFNKGKLFYAEYNLRLFFYLLFKKMDCICAIDLDTILPCYFISKIKKVPRVYDAHEYFCEMIEISRRPFIYSIWKKIEIFSVPKFENGYTVNQVIADEFKKLYQVNYQVIRSLSVKKDMAIPQKKDKYILYQGAVNEGRSFETLVPAMSNVNAPLHIYGDGNFLTQTKELVTQNKLEHKIIFKGKVTPEQLSNITLNATIGLTLFEPEGLSNYYSLANRFFDYMHAAIPQLCVDYPAYREINEQYEIAVLISDLSAENISRQLNMMLNDDALYSRLQQNCMKAREIFNWQNEEQKLISFYKNLLG